MRLEGAATGSGFVGNLFRKRPLGVFWIFFGFFFGSSKKINKN